MWRLSVRLREVVAYDKRTNLLHAIKSLYLPFEVSLRAVNKEIYKKMPTHWPHRNLTFKKELDIPGTAEILAYVQFHVVTKVLRIILVA